MESNHPWRCVGNVCPISWLANGACPLLRPCPHNLATAWQTLRTSGIIQANTLRKTSSSSLNKGWKNTIRSTMTCTVLELLLYTLKIETYLHNFHNSLRYHMFTRIEEYYWHVLYVLHIIHIYVDDIISSYPIPLIRSTVTVLSVTTATVLRITCCAHERPVPAILQNCVYKSWRVLTPWVSIILRHFERMAKICQTNVTNSLKDSTWEYPSLFCGGANIKESPFTSFWFAFKTGSSFKPTFRNMTGGYWMIAWKTRT